jgi:type 1 glutamine amidotransferase
VLDHNPAYQVNVDPHPAAFRGDLAARYDVIVLYDYIPEGLSAERQARLMKYLDNGGGLVVLHHAIVDSVAWPAWWRDVVGGKYLLQPEMNLPSSTYLHGQQIVATPVGSHPIVRGLPPMVLTDETYKGMWRAAGDQVLITTDSPTNDAPLAWVSPWAKSRVVYIQLGHGREAHENPWYRELVSRAILWCGRR